MTTFETAAHAPLVALSLIDGLARALDASLPCGAVLGDVSLEVTERTMPAARTFDPPLPLYAVRTPSGYFVLDGTYVAEPRTGTRYPLANGNYSVTVRSELYQSLSFSLDWPPTGSNERELARVPGEQVLAPGPGYPVPAPTPGSFQLGPTVLRGSLYEANGDPVVGAVVEVTGLAFGAPPPPPWPLLHALTDARGDWLIVLPDRRRFGPPVSIPPPNPPPPPLPPFPLSFAIQRNPPGGPVVVVQRGVKLGSDFSLANTALRGRVVDSAGLPIAGATISASTAPVTSTSRADGQWLLYFDLDLLPPGATAAATVTATRPGGANLSNPGVTVKAGATVIVPTFQFP